MYTERKEKKVNFNYKIKKKERRKENKNQALKTKNVSVYECYFKWPMFVFPIVFVAFNTNLKMVAKFAESKNKYITFVNNMK